jgi:hypothetical protein
MHEDAHLEADYEDLYEEDTSDLAYEGMEMEYENDW